MCDARGWIRGSRNSSIESSRSTMRQVKDAPSK